MKYFFTFLVGFFLVQNIYAQEFREPSEGKSLVYFVRYSSTGMIINFKYFDGDKYLGKANNPNYFIYECEPGEHVFWAASENRDYIKADLKPNATYVIEVKPTMGMLYAGVRLYQIDPKDERRLKRIKKILERKAETKLWGLEDDLTFFIENGMEKYERIKDSVSELDPELFFTIDK